VERGRRVVHGNKELIEKLGRRDPCPCGSGRAFNAAIVGPIEVVAAFGQAEGDR
jgi:hypothetical protein